MTASCMLMMATDEFSEWEGRKERMERVEERRGERDVLRMNARSEKGERRGWRE